VIYRDISWALDAALLAYIIGRCATEPDFSARMAREPWRWLGLCIKWFALFGVGYFVMRVLWITNALPRPLRAQLWTISLALCGMPSVACFVWFIVAWSKWRGRSEQ